ncbi:MAG: serine hydrolase [Lachnospiraceae bacterium]|nr:serine hydrolase [Lachnospiraceae bacterium]
MSLVFTGCGKKEIKYPYDVNTTKNAFRFETYSQSSVADSFASNLAVVGEDIINGEEVETGEDSYVSAILIDTDDKEALYSKNAHAKLYPASMTKVMTAIVALENASPDQILTFTEDCKVTEEGAQLAGLNPGDTMTLDQALHILLIYSANDVANMIATSIAGSVDSFCDMMNDKANELGATNTHFVNPHGLHDENHYTTAYDMYLMFNEATKLDSFNQIIALPEYSTSYKTADGTDKEFKCTSTNRYINGKINAPTNSTVIGGKTGTTIAAGACLVLLSKDKSGRNYISCVMKGDNIDATYGKTNKLLELE